MTLRHKGAFLKGDLIGLLPNRLTWNRLKCRVVCILWCEESLHLDERYDLVKSPLIGKHVGPYRLLETIGKGGYGAVYLATHIEQGGEFAVKLMHGVDERDKEKLDRFHREATVMSRLHHDNIVRLVDFGHSEIGYLYLVMERLQGATLHEHFQQQTVFTYQQLKGIVQQLCSALDYIHQFNMIHRDLKLGNVFLEQRGDSYHCKLIDFGIVLLQGHTQITEAGSCVGTATYISPEQILQTREVDGRSDFYSLAIILYAMLTRRFPFEDKNPLRVIYMQAHESPPLLRESADWAHWVPELEAFFQKALAKERDKRPQTGADFYREWFLALGAQEHGQQRNVSSESLAKTDVAASTKDQDAPLSYGAQQFEATRVDMRSPFLLAELARQQQASQDEPSDDFDIDIEIDLADYTDSGDTYESIKRIPTRSFPGANTSPFEPKTDPTGRPVPFSVDDKKED